MNPTEHYPLLFLVALLATLLATPLAKCIAQHLGAIDKPDERRINKVPIPRMGGIGIALGLVAAVAVQVAGTKLLGWPTVFVPHMQLQGADYKLLTVAVVIVFLTGAIDDVRNLKPRQKLLGQILAACVAAASGLVIGNVANPFTAELIPIGWLAYPITVVYLVAFTNVINLIDGLDGLAVGVSTISCVTILVVALLVSEPNVALIVAALAGACIGFMPYNLNPARIFMGDTGSLLLGYVLATVSVLGLFKFYAIVTFVVPVLALAVPLSDTLFAFCRRILHGQSPFHADRGHFHHKLMDLGLNQKQAVAILYAISATLGLAAVVLTTKGTIRIALLILALLIGFVVCAFIRKSVHKHHLDVELQEAKAAAEAETAAAAENTAPVQEGNDEQTH